MNPTFIHYLQSSCSVFLFIRFIKVLSGTTGTIVQVTKSLNQLLQVNAAEKKMWSTSTHPLQTVVMAMAECDEFDRKTREEIRNIPRNMRVSRTLSSLIYLISSALLWFK